MQPFALSVGPVSSMVSIGVATTLEGIGPEELIRQADLALYAAKRDGKGNWRRYQASLHTSVLERLELRTALDRAIVERAFTLVYQPIVELSSNRIVGLEALVRWNDPVRGVVPPAEFIEVAEESGLVVPLGAWALENALAEAGTWPEKAGTNDPPYISVNVSAVQVRAPGFVDGVRRALRACGVAPSLLMLEITESLLLRDDEQVWVDLMALRDLGVRIAIDDFGTGYSSLSYLRLFPIDLIKIDKSFIGGLNRSAKQAALVEAIVQLRHPRPGRDSRRHRRAVSAQPADRGGLPFRPRTPVRPADVG